MATLDYALFDAELFGDVGKEVSGGKPIHDKQYSYLFGPQFRFVDTAKVQTGFKLLRTVTLGADMSGLVIIPPGGIGVRAGVGGLESDGA